ncbi:MAG: hypothetical protein EGS62_04325, partial [Ruminococcus sp.]|nr:hypothetical protein [Ruminococcus sp.]
LPEVKYIGGRLLSGFGRKKSGVLISPKGKRERRRLRCRILFSICHYLGGGLHGRKKRVKAQSESSKSVVNSVLISREMPVFPGFFEIIRVVIKNIVLFLTRFCQLLLFFIYRNAIIRTSQADKILFIEQILCRVQPNTPILYQI